MSDHAKLSPSAAHRWMACPGSVAATRGLSDPDTAYSLAGTRAHAIAAYCLLHDHDAARYVGALASPDLQDTPWVQKLEPFGLEEGDAVQEYLNDVRREVMLHGGELRVEQRARVAADLWGTADAVLVLRGADKGVQRIVVWDYKHGAGKYVEVEDNPQLIIYALGVLAELGWPPHLVPEIELRVAQPRFRGAAALRGYMMTGAQLDNWKVRVLAAADRARAPEAPLAAGDHCQFCPARGTCPELQRSALAVAQDVFSNIDAPLATEDAAKATVSSYTPDQLARALAGADVVEAWLKAVRLRAFEVARAGKPVPGYKLVHSVGHRAWRDPATAASVLAKHGVQPYVQEIISPAQAEKASKSLRAIIAQLVTRPVSGTVLVPEADRRPAVNPADAFTELPLS